MFRFARCHCCLAVVEPNKYESETKDLTTIPDESDLFVMEKLTNRALVTPPQMDDWCYVF